MRVVALTVAFLFAVPASAQSSCTCICLDGRAQALCTNPTEVSICTPDVCPRPPSVLAPLPPPEKILPEKIQPVCTSTLVWNKGTKQWEYRQVCTKA